MNDAKTGEMPPSSDGTKRSEVAFRLNVNIKCDPPRPCPIWIIKNGRGYMRIPTSGGFLMVRDRRLATRLDSKLWAHTLSRVWKGARVVRLWSKDERAFDAAMKVASSVIYSYAKDPADTMGASASPPIPAETHPGPAPDPVGTER